MDGSTGAGATGGASGTGGTGGKGGSSGTVTTPDAGEGGEGTGPKPDDPECTPGIPGTSQIPRLTNAQYDRTVRDLLQVTTLTSGGAPSSLLAPDSTGGLTDRGWAGYWAAGEAIAKQVMADAALQQLFLACEPSAVDSACLHDSVATFGRRAFRRPLTQSELDRFDTIAARGAELTPTGAPLEIAEVLLNTFLVSPSFIQRSEISVASDQPGPIALSPYEVASRLSYLLWGSAPDPALDQVADDNLLTTPAQIRVQAERLLADPKAREVVTAFHRGYVRATPGGRWGLAKDPARFPAVDETVLATMGEETERFFEHVVFEQQGSFGDLFTSPVAYVSAATAPLYGLDPSAYGAELELVMLDPDTRPGFLTRVGFLSAFASYDQSAPITRGAFVMNDVLGQSIGPDSHDSVTTPVPGGPFETNRAFTDARTAAEAECAGCHDVLNAPGYALESYDAVGAWQTADADSGAPIDTAAEVFIDGEQVPVAGAAELMQALAESRDARREYAKRWVSYAYERDSHELDSCTVKELGTALTGEGYTLLDLLADLTQPESFRVRVKETP